MTIDYIDRRIKKTLIPQKGYGFIATDFIPKHTIILTEHPSFRIDNYKSNTHEIFELIYVILTSNNENNKNKFLKYLPKTMDKNFTAISKKITDEFKNLKLKNPHIYKYLNSNYSMNDIILFCLKYVCNAFNFFEDGPIILLNGSIFNHSCNPNIIFGKNNESKMVFITIKDINKGEEIQNCYIDIFKSTIERKKNLLNQYGFICKCDRCNKNFNNISNLKKAISVTKELYSNLKFNNI